MGGRARMVALSCHVERPADAAHLVALLEEAGEAYGYTEADLPLPAPSTRRIDRMDAIQSWVDLIPLDPANRHECGLWSRHGGAMLRRLVWARSLVNPRSQK